MSMSSVSTRPYARSDTPSSILSSDSDIRFTRKLGGQYRCTCYVATGIIISLLLAILSLYITYKYVSLDENQEESYRGVMRITEGDVFAASLADPATPLFNQRAAFYRESLNLLFRRSRLRSAFISSDILAFDGEEKDDLVVHFILHFNQRRMDVSAGDILEVLSEGSHYLTNRTMDPLSLLITEAERLVTPRLDDTEDTSSGDLVTTTLGPGRLCAPMELTYCTRISNNITSYPNLIGHTSITDLMEDVIIFRELVDSECYRLAHEFVCSLLQPPCSEDLQLPCRAFCQEFWAGCGDRLPARLIPLLNCSYFPEYSAEGPLCLPKPGCTQDLEWRGLTSWLCDGVPDCPDFSDESSCSNCMQDNSLHCTTTAACISRSALCDGVPDCPDGSDERACLFLAPGLSPLKAKKKSVQAKHYFPGGNVIFTEKGVNGKLCVESVNGTMEEDKREALLRNIGTSLCKNLSFRDVSRVKVDKDKELDSKYVKMENPSSESIKFIPTECPDKDILSVECTQLECGLQTVRGRQTVDGLHKVATPGDWPWHVTLFQNSRHVCDGSLVGLQWVATTASCFQGQARSEWVSRVGSTRLGSTPPWQQERHVVGMVKSPVEGSTVVLLKLERALIPSDFVRPICLVEAGSSIATLTNCNALGWGNQRTVLQRVDIKLSKMEQCSNISITTVNSVCADSSYSLENCDEEEVSGSPMVCLNSERRWVLAGVSNWKISCSKGGGQRPRLYDQIVTNVDWMRTTMSNV